MAGRRRAEPRYLVIGRVTAPFGVKGEVKVEVLTDFPERFAHLERVYLEEDGEPVAVEQVRPHKNRFLLKLAGYDSREAAEKLRGRFLHIPVSEAVPLEPGEYYEYQIVGLEVYTTEGERLGSVREIIFTGANDVYVVQGNGREILLPAIEDVIKEVDLENERLVVELIEGLV